MSAHPYSHLSDSLERELARAAITGERAYSVLEGIAIVARAISRGAAAAGRYFVQISEALNEARARDARFSGTQW